MSGEMEVVEDAASDADDCDGSSVIGTGFRDVEFGQSDGRPFYRNHLFLAGVATGSTLTTLVVLIAWLAA
jgi:hypothetical protein